MRLTITTRIEGGRRVADPDPLISGVPGLLGFVPERSVVLMGLDDDFHITATMRHDLLRTERGFVPAPLRGALDRLGGLAASWGWRGALALIVDDRVPVGDECHQRTLRAIGRGFASAGGLAAAFAISELVAGARWQTIRHQRGSLRPFRHDLADDGTLSDPLLNAAALNRAVMRGRGVVGPRSALAAELQPGRHCTDPVCTPRTPVATAGPMRIDEDARLLAIAYEAVVDRAAGVLDLSCARVNALAEALVSVHVRDALLGLCQTVHRDAAASLWADLTRRLTGTPRAAAAILLAYLHYMDGSGAAASVAFDVAHEADPGYALANLLDTALVHGMRPSELEDLGGLSFGLAGRLGVTYPPPTYRAAG